MSFGIIDLKKQHLKKIFAIEDLIKDLEVQIKDKNTSFENKSKKLKILYETISNKLNTWHTAINNFEILLNSIDQFIQYNQAFKYNQKLIELLELNSRYDISKDIPENLRSLYTNFLTWMDNFNNEFYKSEALKYEDYFKTIESNPLTPSQTKAVIANELNNLVLAGAGSGKTSVVIARVGYLLKKEMARADEILVLAFNKAAAAEVRERIKSKLNVDIEVRTFHSYGNMIYNFQKIRKVPCDFFKEDDKTAYIKHLRTLLSNMLEDDKEFYNEFIKYFLESFHDVKQLFEFKSESEYRAYVKQNELRTLAGYLVKSSEELCISNFLTLNGIKHAYEKDYKIQTASLERRQYKPDFYLTDYDIYIEHFGINEKGQTAPYIDSLTYNTDMKWKINAHSVNKTTLIQTFSYEMSKGILLSGLKDKLEKHQVKFTPIPFDEVLKKLNEIHVIDNFTSLLDSFLNHFKSNDLTIEDLYNRISNKQKREKSFISIFDKFLKVYEFFKQQNSCIDFHDMINQANRCLKEKEYKPNYKYIIVDEFQDISIARSKLVTLTRDFVEGSVVTVVGDDWQAINQFAGSDVEIIKQFSNHYGFTETIMLDNTFRFDNNVSKIATNFILKNKTQITKEIIPFNKTDKPSIFLHWYDESEKDYLDKTITHITNKHDTSNKTLMILGRNKYSYPEDINDIIKKHKSNFFIAKDKVTKKGIRKLTAHKSKGLEDDFVILTGLKESIIGFPTKILNNPILNIVLNSSDQIEYAEERRLFYVALTRVKKELHLVVEQNSPSSFVLELLKDFPKDIIQINERSCIDVACPKCISGFQKIKKVKKVNNSEFITCTNYPKCDFSLNLPKCSKCSSLFYKDENHYRCSNKECNEISEICPECEGMLFVKNGRKGKFIGCSNYNSNNCQYSKNLPKEYVYMEKEYV